MAANDDAPAHPSGERTGDPSSGDPSSGRAPPRDPATPPVDRSVPVLLSATIGRLRRDPALFVPFLFVGVLLTVVDRLRPLDPIPAVERTGLGENGVRVQVEFVGYPTGLSRTTLPLESLVDLHAAYLAWGIALYLVPLFAIAVAGTVTMARAMDRNVRPRTVASVFGYVLAMDLGHRALTSIDSLQGMGLWGLAPLAAYFFAMVRLFAVPGLLVAGRRPWTALRRSVGRTRGRGWSVFGVVLAVGLAAWLLVSPPIGGTLLNTALVAPVHAVAIVVFLERGRVED